MGSSSITNIILLTPNHAFQSMIRRVKLFTENLVLADLYAEYFFLAQAEYFYCSADFGQTIFTGLPAVVERLLRQS